MKFFLNQKMLEAKLIINDKGFYLDGDLPKGFKLLVEHYDADGVLLEEEEYENL
jgi:hypothetical protein